MKPGYMSSDESVLDNKEENMFHSDTEINKACTNLAKCGISAEHQ